MLFAIVDLIAGMMLVSGSGPWDGITKIIGAVLIIKGIWSLMMVFGPIRTRYSLPG